MKYAKKPLVMVLLVALVAVLAMSGAANAFFQLLVNENFEQDPALWPWDTDNQGNQGWGINPGPNTQHPYYTWAVEESTIYHYIGPEYYRSIWCSGLPNNFIPGEDDYPPNQLALVFWGPFEIDPEEMHQVGGLFYYWAETEPWYDGAGDNFWMVAKDNPNLNNPDPTEWYVGYAFDTGVSSPPAQWIPLEFDFEDLTTWDGDSVSLMPDSNETIEDVYIGWFFYSDSDNFRGRGVFLDDISFGYDDGQFDYEASRPLYYSKVDSQTYQEAYYIYQNDSIYVKNVFIARGANPDIPASHVLYLNPDIMDTTSEWFAVDTMTALWHAEPLGATNRVFFDTPWVPDDSGYWGIKVVLDVDSVQEEAFEDNNEYIDTMFVNLPQTPPEIIWHDIIGSIDQDTLVIVVSDTMETFTIDYTATNSPPAEGAALSFMIADTITDMPEVIPELFGLGIDNQRHQVECPMYLMQDSLEYYLYAYLNDGYYTPTLDICPIKVMKITEEMDVDDVAVGEIPTEFALESVYPNPFNPTVELEFAVPQTGDIQVTWYSLEGRQVDKQVLREVAPGYHKMQWTPQNLASGMYLMRANSPAGMVSAKVVYMK